MLTRLHNFFLQLFPLFTLITFSSCALFLNIHVKLVNPKHASSYPLISEATRLLGNQKAKYRTCFDVTYYTLNVSVDEKKKYLNGEVEISATALTACDTLQIDLYANMKINKITCEGKNLSYVRAYGAVFIIMPKRQSAGEKFKLLINYEGSPLVAKKPPWKGGFVWKKDKDNNPWIGVACESEGASLWWPCKDVNNDEPDSMAINVSTNTYLPAVCNGHLIGKETTGNVNTFKWRVSYPINLYDVTLYIGNFKLLQDTMLSKVTGNIINLDYYVLPKNYEKAKVHFTQVKPQLSFYEKIYGAYPWYKDGFKLIESPYEGMEHQSAIAYGSGYKNIYQKFDYIILHESAHEWWGNSVSAADFADVWIQEGFATFSEALYVESTEGREAYLRYLLTYRLFIQNKWPVVGPTNERYFNYKNSDCYQKGAWILHTLRTQIANDSIFFDILRSFRGKYNMKTVVSKDFINTVNEKTQHDYNWFFNQYLYKRESPFLEYYWDENFFYYRWKYTDATFVMPTEIGLDGLVRTTLNPTTQLQRIPISGKTYKEITFNIYTELFGVIQNKHLSKEWNSTRNTQ